MEHDLLAQKRTAYALGELDAAERAVLEADLLKSEAHRLEVEEIRALAAALSGALVNEKTPGMLEIQHLAIESTLQQMTEDHEATARMRLRRQRIAFWVPTALAACALLASGIAIGMLSQQSTGITPPTSPDEKIVTGPGGNTGIGARPGINDIIGDYNDVVVLNPPTGAPVVYGPHVDNVVVDPDSVTAFHSVGLTPLSSFPLTVNTNTAAFVQRFIQRGVLPRRETVHVEAMINAFAYDDVKDLQKNTPANDRTPVAVKTEVSECPWNAGHKLARVVVKAIDGPGGTIVAEDVRVRVEFNPARVASYRLIGYVNRAPGDGITEREEGPSLAAGHTLTALYEIVPLIEKRETALDPLKYQFPARLTPSATENSQELFTVLLSFRTDENPLEQTVEAPAIDDHIALAKASNDFRFAAAVAQFGLILLDPPTVNGKAQFDAILALASSARGPDATSDRKRFLDLVADTRRLVAN